MTETFEEGRQYKIVYLDEFVIHAEVVDITDTHYIFKNHKGLIHRKKENVLKIDPLRQEKYESDM